MGVDHFVRDLQKFGVRGLQRDEFYGPSLALGSADVTLWDLTMPTVLLPTAAFGLRLRFCPW